MATPVQGGVTKGKTGVAGRPGIAIALFEKILEPGQRCDSVGAVEHSHGRLVRAAINQVTTEGLNKGREAIGKPFATWRIHI